MDCKVVATRTGILQDQANQLSRQDLLVVGGTSRRGAKSPCQSKKPAPHLHSTNGGWVGQPCLTRRRRGAGGMAVIGQRGGHGCLNYCSGVLPALACERYFELVKSAGHHLESWQQESAIADASWSLAWPVSRSG